MSSIRGDRIGVMIEVRLTNAAMNEIVVHVIAATWAPQAPGIHNRIGFLEALTTSIGTHGVSHLNLSRRSI